jgi:16S rRNA (guanine527-N7)-methyltransferase
MDAARIVTLLSPFLRHPLADTQLTQISTYIDLLLRWNARTNLTAIRDPEAIVTRHFGESLFAARILFPPAPGPAVAASTDAGSANLRPTPAHVGAGALTRPAGRSSAESPHAQPRESASGGATPLDLLDIGSGAGFPGLPIKLWAPHLRTTLLESQNKKVAFLREVIRALTLTDINVSPARAGDFPASSTLVTLRAVEHFESILPVASHRLAQGGRLALLIGEPQVPVARTLAPSLSWAQPIPIPLSSTRILLIGSCS